MTLLIKLKQSWQGATLLKLQVRMMNCSFLFSTAIYFASHIITVLQYFYCSIYSKIIRTLHIQITAIFHVQITITVYTQFNKIFVALV